MRVCIAGTSHLAALQLALREGNTALNADEVIFTGAPGNNFKLEVKLKDGVLFSQGRAREMFLLTSEGKYDKIDPSEFDVIFFYGLDYKLFWLFESLVKNANNEKIYFSGDFLKEGAKRWVQARRAFKIVAAMRKVNDIPIALCSAPFLSSKIKENNPSLKLINRPIVENIYLGIQQALDDVGVTAIFQPDHSVVGNCLTDEKFSNGAVRLPNLNEQHSDKDNRHMNSEFGGHMLNVISEWLQTVRHQRNEKKIQ